MKYDNKQVETNYIKEFKKKKNYKNIVSVDNETDIKA